MQNEKGEWSHPSRVAAVSPAKPKPDPLPALDQGQKARKGAIVGVGLRVVIIRRGKNQLDGDNLAFAYKGLRDAIAWSLDIDDGDPRVRWEYNQLPGKPYGTIVLLST